MSSIYLYIYLIDDAHHIKQSMTQNTMRYIEQRENEIVQY